MKISRTHDLSPTYDQKREVFPSATEEKESSSGEGGCLGTGSPEKWSVEIPRSPNNLYFKI
jgi:hypothetical protein